MEEGEKKINKSSDDIQVNTSNNPDRCTDIAQGQHDTIDQKQDETNPDHDDDIKKKEIFQEDCSEDHQDDKGRSCSVQSGEIGTIERRSTQAEVVHEDETQKSRNGPNDDGFTTPTSSDHKIPVMTTCPPAPKKSIKRRFPASPNIHSTLHVDFESIIDQEGDLGGNINKLRKTDHQE